MNLLGHSKVLAILSEDAQKTFQREEKGGGGQEILKEWITVHWTTITIYSKIKFHFLCVCNRYVYAINVYIKLCIAKNKQLF